MVSHLASRTLLVSPTRKTTGPSEADSVGSLKTDPGMQSAYTAGHFAGRDPARGSDAKADLFLACSNSHPDSGDRGQRDCSP